MSNPESTTILDNYTVIAPLNWPSTKRAAEDYERRIFRLLSGQRLRRKKSLENSRNEKRASRNAEASERNKCAVNASFNHK